MPEPGPRSTVFRGAGSLHAHLARLALFALLLTGIAGSGASAPAQSPANIVTTVLARANASPATPAPSLTTPPSASLSSPLPASVHASALAGRPPGLPGPWTDPGTYFGKNVLPGVTMLTGHDLKPYQTRFRVPELADPYVTLLPDSLVISGTAQYHLKFKTLADLARGGPYQLIWNDFYYPDGTPMEGDRHFAHSWDMKPVLWSRPRALGESPRLWQAGRDTEPPLQIWYGGRMRPAKGRKTAGPEDNYSRDVFAFVEGRPGRWISREESVFARARTWPRPYGDFSGHRYGHQIVTVPKMKDGKLTQVPVIFYEEVTQVRAGGSPAVTKIFMDEMASPFEAKGRATELINPFHPVTGKPLPSAVREDGAMLVEGPLYFRFPFENEEWEAIGFSAGSFYAKYPAAFAARRVAEGLLGKPYRLDLNDDGFDLHDAGAELGRALGLAGGPGRPAVIVAPDGRALPGPDGALQVLVHGYRKDILPDNDHVRGRLKYRLDQMFRVALHASLVVSKGPNGALRFRIHVPNEKK